MPDLPTPAAPADFQLSQEPVTPPTEAPVARSVPAPAYEYLGELPASYGASSVYLVAYDPRRLFAYWDLDAATVAAVDAPLALRVCRTESGEVESQVDLGRALGTLGSTAAGAEPGCYLPVTRSGTSYHVELGTGGGTGGAPWRRLAVSSAVVVPPEGLAAAADGDAHFATLPFHLSFQRLTELLRATFHTEGRPLTEAIAELQQATHATPTDAALVEALGQLTEEQRQGLETVLGWEPGPSSTDVGGSEAPSSLGANALAGGGVTSEGGSGGLTSSPGGAAPSSAAMFAARAAGGSEAGGPSSGAFAAGLSSAALIGARGAGASGGGGILGPGPSSEVWRRAVAAGAVAGSGGGSDQFARERADRFLRAVTSSLDVLSPLFSGNLASGSSSAGGSSGR